MVYPEPGSVLGVFTSGSHDFSKRAQDSVMLLKGLGIEGDAHCGVKVKHRYDAKRDPERPNLRQVHLLQSELLDELNESGFTVQPGDIGENVTTRGVDLLALPVGTLLRIGGFAVLEVTGLRNPCWQIDAFQKGLMKAVLDRDADGGLVRRSGIMSIVAQGGPVRPGDPIAVELPDGPFQALGVV